MSAGARFASWFSRGDTLKADAEANVTAMAARKVEHFIMTSKDAVRTSKATLDVTAGLTGRYM